MVEDVSPRRLRLVGSVAIELSIIHTLVLSCVQGNTRYAVGYELQVWLLTTYVVERENSNGILSHGQPCNYMVRIRGMRQADAACLVSSRDQGITSVESSRLTPK